MKPADIANESALYLAIFTPSDCAAISLSLIATNALPVGDLRMLIAANIDTMSEIRQT